LSDSPPPTTIVISALASGPIPPTAANATWPNVLHTRVADVVGQMGPPPWSRRLIADERNLVTLIAIRNVGDELSLRLAVAMPPAMHYASPCEQCGYTDDGPRAWCA